MSFGPISGGRFYKRLNDNHYFNQKSQAKHSLQKSEVKFIDSKLKDREKQFCACYAETGDVRLSARLAGYRLNSRAKGIKLLSRDDIRGGIERLLISKEKLAEEIGVHARTLSNYDNRPENITLSQIDCFLRANDLEIKDLI